MAALAASKEGTSKCLPTQKEPHPRKDVWTSHPRRRLETCGAGKEEAFYTSSSGSLQATYYWTAAMEWVIYPDISQFPRLDSSATHSWGVGQRDSRESE